MNKNSKYRLALNKAIKLCTVAGATVAAVSARADGAWAVPTPPDVSSYASTGTTIFQTGATLGLTILGLSIVVGMLMAGLRARKSRS